jgi:hypothetical protein
MKLILATAIVGTVLALPTTSSAAPPPSPTFQDSVSLTGGVAHVGAFSIETLNASSGPSGENPTGNVSFNVVGLLFPIDGPVTCLAVNGNSATINAQDQDFGVITVQVVDSQPDTFDSAPTGLSGRAPTDCSPLPPTGAGGPVSGGDITVVDAQPPPTRTQECKNGGWKQFGFKNQGQCIAFVNQSP